MRSIVGGWVKVKKPYFYPGDRNLLEDRITQIRIYFGFNPIADDRKVHFASNFLRGRAQRWIRLQLKQFLHQDEDAKEKCPSVFKFEKEFFSWITHIKLRSFRVFNEARTGNLVAYCGQWATVNLGAVLEIIEATGQSDQIQYTLCGGCIQPLNQAVRCDKCVR